MGLRHKFIFNGHRRDWECYLQAVDEIQSSQDYMVMEMAIACLQLEFHNILISYTREDEQKNLEKSHGCFGLLRFIGDSSTEIDAVSLDAINNLRCITERMISSAYALVKKLVFDTMFQRFQINGIQWKQLRVEVKIHRWQGLLRFVLGPYTSCVTLTLSYKYIFEILDPYIASENLMPDIRLLLGSESSIPVMASELLSCF
ncbi:hypothetical protein RJT34_17052 [Clitoria ternatea]|uniref:Uncharacterized protein n=1 Tax=Clitoria ternatea TaxID=43366 RepID=A0AAN9PCW3_CLITE